MCGKICKKNTVVNLNIQDFICVNFASKKRDQWREKKKRGPSKKSRCLPTLIIRFSKVLCHLRRLSIKSINQWEWNFPIIMIQFSKERWWWHKHGELFITFRVKTSIEKKCLNKVSGVKRQAWLVKMTRSVESWSSLPWVRLSHWWIVLMSNRENW
jgi:hypothetical protein